MLGDGRWILVAAGALLACCNPTAGVNEQTLVDTTGASFTQLCGSTQCTVTSTTPTPPACIGVVLPETVK